MTSAIWLAGSSKAHWLNTSLELEGTEGRKTLLRAGANHHPVWGRSTSGPSTNSFGPGWSDASSGGQRAPTLAQTPLERRHGRSGYTHAGEDSPHRGDPHAEGGGSDRGGDRRAALRGRGDRRRWRIERRYGGDRPSARGHGHRARRRDHRGAAQRRDRARAEQVGLRP